MSVHMHPYTNHICDRGPQKSPLSPEAPAVCVIGKV